MPAPDFITLVTQGYGYTNLQFDATLSAPNNVVAVWQPDYRSVLISWSDTNSVETTYAIFRSDNGQEFYYLTSVPVDTTAFLDTIDLVNSKKYQYKIYATSDTGYGAGAYSNILSPRNISSFPTVDGLFSFDFSITLTGPPNLHDSSFLWSVVPDQLDLNDYGFASIVEPLGLPISPASKNFTWSAAPAISGSLLTDSYFSYIVEEQIQIKPSSRGFVFTVEGD